MLRHSTINIHIKKSKLHINELWFFPWFDKVLDIKLMVVFAFKSSASCIKLKVPFQIHRSHFQNGAVT